MGRRRPCTHAACPLQGQHGGNLGAAAAPNVQEYRGLFLAWQELGPQLAYTPENGEWQAVEAMRDLLHNL